MKRLWTYLLLVASVLAVSGAMLSKHVHLGVSCAFIATSYGILTAYGFGYKRKTDADWLKERSEYSMFGFFCLLWAGGAVAFWHS
jgi:hypothetical protein